MLGHIGGLNGPGAVAEPAEARIVRPDGSELIVESISVPTTWDGAPAFQVIFRDVTERQANELQLLFQATHDALTGLTNRGPLLDELQQRLDRATGPEAKGTGLLFIDLDRFKAVNDALGHISGDEFLTVIARRLTASSPTPDVVGRLAGDEFVVILDSVRDIDDAMAVARDIGQVISEPTLLRSGQTAAITASIGVAVGDGTSFDAEDMLRRADAAMYRAKQLGRSRVEAYDEVLGEQMRRRLDLQNELPRRARPRRHHRALPAHHRLGERASRGSGSVGPLAPRHPGLGGARGLHRGGRAQRAHPPAGRSHPAASGVGVRRLASGSARRHRPVPVGQRLQPPAELLHRRPRPHGARRGRPPA